MSKIIIDTNDSDDVIRILSNAAQEVLHFRGMTVSRSNRTASTECPESDPPITEPSAPPPAVQRVSGNIDMNPLDSAGLPWDSRIHSDSKATNKDGTWRSRRGVNDALIESVTRELRDSAPPVGVPPVPGIVPPVPTAMVPLASPAPNEHVTDVLTWPILLGKVFASRTANTYNVENEAAFLKHYGIDNGFASLSLRPDLFQEFATYMGIV